MSSLHDGQDSRERRQNVVLRDLLDEMLQLARHVANNVDTMTEDELTYARERLDWLVDEVWEQATGGRKRER